jgi:hypothetical protein
LNPAINGLVAHPFTQSIMPIVGNILVLLLLPVTLAATLSLRDTFHAAGPDSVGPTFVMVIAVALRWLLAAVVIGLCVARGGFDDLVPFRPLQWFIIAGLVFALDAAACMAVTAVSRSGAAPDAVRDPIGMGIGHVLPLLVVLALLVPLNAPANGSPGSLRVLTVTLALVAVASFAYFQVIDSATIKRKWEAFDAAQAERNDFSQTYLVTLDQIPKDAPPDRYAAYFQDPNCPEDVRSQVVQRLLALPDLRDQLVAMLSDDRRELAMQLFGRTGSLHAPADVAALFKSSFELANTYRDRLSSGDDTAVTGCADAAALAAYFTHGQSAAGVDFRPTMEAWNAALAVVKIDDDRVANARHEVQQWLALNPPPVH